MSTSITGLAEELALRGLTQEGLARKAGIAVPTANAAVNGRRVTARTAYKIRLALDLSEDAMRRLLVSADSLTDRRAS